MIMFENFFQYCFIICNKITDQDLETGNSMISKFRMDEGSSFTEDHQNILFEL